MDKDDLKQKLDPMAYAVTQEGATEPAFTGKFYDHHERGMYTCVVCGTELFASNTKFDSGTGWPSFTDPKNLEAVELKPDTSHGPTSSLGYEGAGMQRTEVVCKTCGAHLGHVFDEPTPPSGLRGPGSPQWSGKRYCINSCALDFQGRDNEQNDKTAF